MSYSSIGIVVDGTTAFSHLENAEDVELSKAGERALGLGGLQAASGGQGMQNLENTQYFKVDLEPANGAKAVLSTVYEALTEKGYNPVNQIVGYIMSGDPTYITSHKSARSLIMKVERDELVEEMLVEYIKNSLR